MTSPSVRASSGSTISRSDQDELTQLHQIPAPVVTYSHLAVLCRGTHFSISLPRSRGAVVIGQRLTISNLLEIWLQCAGKPSSRCSQRLQARRCHISGKPDLIRPSPKFFGICNQITFRVGTSKREPWLMLVPRGSEVINQIRQQWEALQGFLSSLTKGVCWLSGVCMKWS